VSRTETSHRVAHLEVDAEQAGQRLDNYLLARLKGVPRSHVYRLIRSGQVRVNSGRSNPRYRLKAGDSVRIPPVRDRRETGPGPDAAGLDWLERRIIYEDDRLLVVDKPSGLAVHGGSGVELGCIEALRSLRPGLKTLELAHRLDRGTSGCLIVAKRRSALRTLHTLFREGQVDKRYLALVRGDWQLGTVTVDERLVVSREPGIAKVRIGAGGKEALSEFRLVERFGKFASLVEATIATGRTHQIRVHAAHLGHPIAGDDRYGDRDFNADTAASGSHRLFLHAHAVQFEWPDSDQTYSISAPLPDDLRRFLDGLTRR
jgi:23S rRNA pseudouridine955/2504/2580 synthase